MTGLDYLGLTTGFEYRTLCCCYSEKKPNKPQTKTKHQNQTIPLSQFTSMATSYNSGASACL